MRPTLALRTMVRSVGSVRGAFERRRAFPLLLFYVLLLGVLLLGVLGLAGCGEQRPNVLVLSIDSLRADHLGCYGYQRPTSPAIDALARDAAVFERAYAHAPFTAPSHASLFTSLNVQSHGVTWWDGRIDPGAATMAERFAAAHWRTGAFYNHPSLAPTGIERGFQHVEKRNWEPWRPTVDGFLDWIDREDSAFCAWIHLWDVHRPYGWRDYQAIERSFGVEIDWEPARFPYFEARFGEPHDTAVGRSEEFYNLDAAERAARRFALGGTQRPLAERDYAYIRDRYDGGVAYADDAVAALVAGLSERGLLEDTAVVITADHGEALTERSACFYTHDPFLFEETLRVPLVVRLPGRLGAGSRPAGLARHIDVLPTLLEFAGLPPRAGDQGTSLLGLLSGAAPEPRLLLAETRARQAKESGAKAAAGGPGNAWVEERSALFDGRYKLIEDHSAGTTALYDLASDPGEVRDLSGSPLRVVELERLRRELSKLKATLPVAGSDSAGLDLEALRLLGHQGYVEVEDEE